MSVYCQETFSMGDDTSSIEYIMFVFEDLDEEDERLMNELLREGLDVLTGKLALPAAVDRDSSLVKKWVQPMMGRWPNPQCDGIVLNTSMNLTTHAIAAAAVLRLVRDPKSSGFLSDFRGASASIMYVPAHVRLCDEMVAHVRMCDERLKVAASHKRALQESDDGQDAVAAMRPRGD